MYYLHSIGLDVLLVTTGILIGSASTAWLIWRWTRAANSTEADRERQNLRRVIDRLQTLTVQMANDLGEHSANVLSINEGIEAIDDGDVGEVVDCVAQILAANERLQERLAAAETRLQEQATQIEFHAAEARTDSLTGLPNRRAFDVEIARRVAEFHRKGTVLCVAMVDVDRFKRLNDQHGHLAGDEALRQLAGKLASALRDMDLVARYGGEEFGVVTPATGMEHVKMVAERCRALIADSPISVGEFEASLSVSIGIAEVQHGDNASSLIQRADEAVYAAKRAGRNRVYWHDGKVPQCVFESSLPEPDIEPVVPQEDGMERNENVPPHSTARVQDVLSEVEPTQPPIVTSVSDDAACKMELEANEATDSDSVPEPEAAEAIELTRECDRTAFCWNVRQGLAETYRGASAFSLLFAYLSIQQTGNGPNRQGHTHAYSVAARRYLEAALRDADIIARYSPKLYSILLPETSLVEAVSVARCLQVQLLDGISGIDQVSLDYGLGLTESRDCDEWMEIIRRGEDAVKESQRLGGVIACYTPSGLRSLPLHEATGGRKEDDCVLADHSSC